MKKKVVALMMSAVMAFSLAACGGQSETGGSAESGGAPLRRTPARTVRAHRKAHLRRKVLRLRLSPR